MIKFFRKFRQKLLTENKFSKHMLYAIGEIVLVVIGILIALSINNWNENNKKKDNVKVYLQNYVEDLKDDKRNMKLFKDNHQFRYHLLQHLLKICNEPQYYNENYDSYVPPLNEDSPWAGVFPEEFDKKFIQVAFEHSQRTYSDDLNLSTINEMKNIGLLSYLKNDDLKEAINNYYRQWNGRLGEYTKRKSWGNIEKWEAAIAEGGIITSAPFANNNPLSHLKDHPFRLVLLKNLVRDSEWKVWCAEQTDENVDDLIAKVQAEINRYEN